MSRVLKYFGVFSGVFVTLIVCSLTFFISIKAFYGFNEELFFGGANPIDVIMGEAIAWEGLWNPLYGSLRLMLLSGIFAVPMGLAVGIYLSEFAPKKIGCYLLILLESVAGLPSIIVGLFGFMMILFLYNNFFPAKTCLLLASFCLSVLVLPSLALNTYSAVKSVPDSLRLAAASLGMSKNAAVFKVFIPACAEGIFSGLLMAVGRCAEDTAVILMTGAVASTPGAGGLLSKFEALPFFIYYQSANYTDETQLVQVFIAAFILIMLTIVFMLSSMILKNKISSKGMLWTR